MYKLKLYLLTQVQNSIIFRAHAIVSCAHTRDCLFFYIVVKDVTLGALHKPTCM